MQNYIDEECSSICSRSNDSVSMFRSLSLEQVDSFKWSDLIIELQTKAPTLHKVVSWVVSHTAARNKVKRGEAQYLGVCMAVGILFKERSREICELQTFVSLALFSATLPKKVYRAFVVPVWLCIDNANIVILT